MNSQIPKLIKKIRNGQPREVSVARMQLQRNCTKEDIPLLDEALISNIDAERKIAILRVLAHLSIRDQGVIEHIVSLLCNHPDWQVRSAAGATLVHSSPKIHGYIGRLQSALKKESKVQVRGALEKLLGRYPNQT
jgi:hypothetical protein